MDLLLWFDSTEADLLMWALHDPVYGITGQALYLITTPVSKLREAFTGLHSIITDHPKVLRYFKVIMEPTLKPLLDQVKVHYVESATLKKYVETIVDL